MVGAVDDVFSTQPYYTPRHMKRSVLLAVLVLALSACSAVRIGSTGDNEQVIGNQHVPVIMLQGKELTDPNHGKELWLGVAPISGVGDMNANGVIQGQYFEDGTYFHSLKVNIELPPAGKQYIGWLLEPDGKEWVRTGELSSPTRDVRHGLRLTLQRDLRMFTVVRVTLESVGSEPTKALVVAEGTLKEQKRR